MKDKLFKRQNHFEFDRSSQLKINKSGKKK